MKKALIVLIAWTLVVSCTSTKSENDTIYSIGQIKTPLGEILIWLYDETPNHKKSFIELANAEYWDSLTFNRVINNFVAQGGCPDTPAGFTDPEYLMEPEFNSSLRHIYGAVGAGRDDNPEKLSARCQFYVVQNKKGLTRLDDNYTVFGYVFKGMDVVDAIVSVPTDSTDAPINSIPLDVNIISMSEQELVTAGYTFDSEKPQ